MNCKFFLASVPAVALAASALGVTSDFYINDGLINCPPQILPQVDATNFVNQGVFSVNFTNVLFTSGQPYRTAGTLNYTNNGLMVANTGFQFDHRPPGFGQPRMAANFVNRGTIACGSVGNTNSIVVVNGLFFSAALSQYRIAATNVVLNSSTNVVGLDGVFGLDGKNVSLDRANIVLEGIDTANAMFTTAGIFDGYWGVGTNRMVPSGQFEGIPRSPFHQVFSQGNAFQQQLNLPAAVAYVDEEIVGTNRFVQAVFLSDTNDAVTKNVYFPARGYAAVEWRAVFTDPLTRNSTTNYLYLTDDFGTWFTNMLVQRYFVVSGQPTYIPWNYYFYRGGPFFFGGAAQPAVIPPGFFGRTFITNDYAAYGAIFQPVTQLPGNVPGLVLTNMPGRIEIVAQDTLDLTRARINGPNYMRLRATNHFAGSKRAEISIPYSDIALASTNGQLAITNLLVPEVPRFTGEIDLYSARWTNNDAFYQNTYSVLLVDSRMSRTAPAQVQDLFLKSTNVLISDVMNVNRACLIDAENLTITTNQAPATPATGELNLLSSQIIWRDSLPRLQNLTNAGIIRAVNAVFLGGSRKSPYYTSNYNEPYQSLVNSGAVFTEGCSIWANYFENTGLFSSGMGYGSISLESQEARLTNGMFMAQGGDITITSGNLIVTNHALQTGRRLTLAVTGLLTDLGTSNINNWAVGQSFNLPTRPAAGDLWGTTIHETAVPGAENPHSWAGADRGPVPEGFVNNATLGRLILEGGVDSVFTFTPAGALNALYVDYLEFRGFTTNKDSNGDLAGVQIDPNMKVYFGQAMINGVSHAEKLNGRHGGRLVWVPSYAGTYSSTNVVYLDGSTNRLNAALVTSENLDSDNDGVPNVFDPEPVFAPSQYRLTASITNAPVRALVLQWQTIGGVTNTLYTATDVMATNWQVVTRFVSPPVVGPPTPTQIAVPLDPGNRFYRVRVDANSLR